MKSLDLDTLLGPRGATPSKACDPYPLVRVGIPYLTKGADNAIFSTAMSLGAPLLVSTGALYRKKEGLLSWPIQLWRGAFSIDSGGFTAMLQGGYRWTPEAYVDWIATNGGGDDDTSGMPFPFEWWAAMDYCCEPEIAADREEVLARIEQTVETYGRCLSAWLSWSVDEGLTGVPEPMPVLQGRRPDDYVDCAMKIANERTRLLNAISVTGLSFADELDGRDLILGREDEGLLGLPALIGVGSVCRREVLGPEGILPVVASLDSALPPYVKLHLFGVKGDTLSHLGPYMGRIASIDSMAWDKTASNEAKALRKKGVKLPAGEKSHYNVPFRAAHLKRWYERQRERLTKILKGRS